MTSNRLLDPPPRNSPEWKQAWSAVARLAATRQEALRAQDQQLQAAADSGPGILAAGMQANPPVPIDASEYARALAEIEQASAALRRAEPALEAWRPDAAIGAEPRKSRSVWILIGGIWISTVAVFAGAIGAILYLFG